MNAINYEKGQGDFKDWLIEESQFDTRHLGKFDAIFAQGNGYLGTVSYTHLIMNQRSKEWSEI